MTSGYSISISGDHLAVEATPEAGGKASVYIFQETAFSVYLPIAAR